MMRTTHGTGSQRESSGHTVRLAMVAAIAVTIAMPSLSAAQAPSDTPAAAFDELPLLVSLGDLMLSSGCSFHPTGVLAAIGVYGGLGAAIGAGVDSAQVDSRVVYDTRGSSRRVSVAPLISRDRKGVAVSLGF